MSSTIHNYFAAVSSLDRDAYLACFSDDAVVVDPYGGRPFAGQEGLQKFVTGLERTWSALTMTPSQMYAAGDRVAAAWTASGTARSGKTADFAGINVFTLNQDGLITHLEGYWDFKALLAQIS